MTQKTGQRPQFTKRLYLLNYWTKTGVSCVGIIIAPNQAELVLTEGKL